MPEGKDVFYNPMVYIDSPRYNEINESDRHRFPKYWHVLDLDEDKTIVNIVT